MITVLVGMVVGYGIGKGLEMRFGEPGKLVMHGSAVIIVADSIRMALL